MKKLYFATKFQPHLNFRRKNGRKNGAATCGKERRRTARPAAKARIQPGARGLPRPHTAAHGNRHGRKPRAARPTACPENACLCTAVHKHASVKFQNFDNMNPQNRKRRKGKTPIKPPIFIIQGATSCLQLAKTPPFAAQKHALRGTKHRIPLRKTPSSAGRKVSFRKPASRLTNQENLFTKLHKIINH